MDEMTMRFLMDLNKTVDTTTSLLIALKEQVALLPDRRDYDYIIRQIKDLIHDFEKSQENIVELLK